MTWAPDDSDPVDLWPVPYQQATDVVGYTGGAELWCPPCARHAFDRKVDGIARAIRQRDAIDYDGNPVTPLFRSDVGPEDRCALCGDTLADGDADVQPPRDDSDRLGEVAERLRVVRLTT